MKITNIIIGFTLVVTAGCATPSRDWNRAIELDTAVAYHSFIEAHRDSSYATEAERRIEELESTSAQTEDTVEALERFISHFPDSAFRPQAGDRIMNLEWLNALNQNSVATDTKNEFGGLRDSHNLTVFIKSQKFFSLHGEADT